MIQTKHLKNKKKGIAIFIAVVTVSALLLISLAISDIAYKEQIISASGRDSRIAFYAADSGVECTLFQDLKGGAGGFAFSVDGADTPPFDCNGVPTNPETTVEPGGIVTTTFHFNVSATPKACAVVRISKANSGAGSTIQTEIESNGYNNDCNAFGDVSEGIRNLERSLYVRY